MVTMTGIPKASVQNEKIDPAVSAARALINNKKMVYESFRI